MYYMKNLKSFQICCALHVACMVTMTPVLQLQRLMLRDGSSSVQAQARIDSQRPLAEKMKLANIVLLNDGSVQQLQEQASTGTGSSTLPLNNLQSIALGQLLEYC